MSTNETDFDSLGLDALLDTTLDDIEDLPSFEPFVAGAHRCLVTFERKVIGDHPAIEVTLKALECLEVADEGDAEKAPKEGDSCNSAFMLDNEVGLGKFKEVAVPFAASLGVNTLRELSESVKDVECVVITNIRTDKNDKSRHYLNIKQIQVI